VGGGGGRRDLRVDELVGEHGHEELAVPGALPGRHGVPGARSVSHVLGGRTKPSIAWLATINAMITGPKKTPRF